MDRLIDEQTAYDILTDYYHHTTDAQHTALREALGRVETVDAVPVVRCKDCARFDKKRGCNLVEGLNIAKTDSFCSYGERKDGDHEKAD